MQAALNGHGFPCAVDGVAGPATQYQIKLFQAAYCGPWGYLDIDGVAGPATQRALQWTVDNNALVTYFSIQEVACKHCGCAYVKRELLSKLFALRQQTGGPVRLACAYRCEEHNSQIGGARNSQHPLGLAADTENVTIDQAKAAGFGSIGSPDKVRATHVDVRVPPVGVFYDKSTG